MNLIDKNKHKHFVLQPW